jgi:hypothetical protein
MYGLKRGQISDPIAKLTYGIGFMGVGDKNSQTHPKAYQTWVDLFKRCYNTDKASHAESYKSCIVDEFFHNFQNFATWYMAQPFHTEVGYQVDKDLLLKGNKVYSPETCCLLPKNLNLSLISNSQKRGEYPIGVTKHGDKFTARVSLGGGERIALGLYGTPEEAFSAYKTAKERYLKTLATKWKDQIDTRAYSALITYEVSIDD